MAVGALGALGAFASLVGGAGGGGLPLGPAGAAGARARVALVASEFAGIVPNGGVGTFYSALANALAGAGHEVTLLFTQGPRSHSPGRSFEDWVAAYAAQGVRLVPLKLGQRNPSVGHHAAVARGVHDWLVTEEQGGNPFDVVHFPDWQGHGCFALLAKHQGLHFLGTKMVVMTHGPLRWARRSSDQAFETQDDLEVDFLEQETIRAADLLVSPSHYLLDWVQNEKWRLPKDRQVFPYIMPSEARAVIEAVAGRGGVAGSDSMESSTSPPTDESPKIPKEVVFFGRLEVRKGVVLFCDAIDRLVQMGQLPDNVKFSFLGSTRSQIGEVRSGDYVAHRMSRWGQHAGSVVSDKDTEGALQFLLAEARLAVLPSLVENSPLSIFELTGTGIPFISSTAGGIPDIIDPADHTQTLFQAGSLEALVGKITSALAVGVRRASSAHNLDKIEKDWVDWHASHAGVAKERLASALSVESSRPLTSPGGGEAGVSIDSGSILGEYGLSMGGGNSGVGVCVALQDRSGVHGTLESVFEHVNDVGEIIFVANHATYELVSELLHGRHAKAAAKAMVGPVEYYSTWYTSSVPEMWNKCLEVATKGRILFMHSGVYALSETISVLQTAARTTGADIVTSHLNFYRQPLPEEGVGAHLASLQGSLRATHVFVGGAVPLGAVKNVFTGPLLFVKRELLQRLGGFNKKAEKDYEAWEFCVRSVLSGATMEVVSQSLYWAPRMEGLQRVYLIPPKMGPVFEAYFNHTSDIHHKDISEFSEAGIRALLKIERGSRASSRGTDDARG